MWGWGGVGDGGGGGLNCVNTLSLEACLKNVLCSVNVQCVHVLCERG